MNRVGAVTRWSSVFMGMLALLLFSRPVQAELYVAGQVGAHVPHDASNVTWSGSGSQFSGSELSMQYSLMYGAKLGYYFDQLKSGKLNLGVETEVFNATPHFQQQGATIGGLSGILVGLSHRVLTWAPVVAVVRYQAGAFEPYAGVGLGVFFSNLAARGVSDSDINVGLNTQVGIRYRVHQHLSLFTEWKYNYANIEHDNIAGSALSLSYDYNAHIVAGGIGYHF